ncbi:mitochondrial Rho GTPase 1-A isoform X1 [Lates japonicus]|uniref:Mitochondrial Rho GTPase 1-A isoform X1 n=1 Tax=Lates japonicus TaxID=270547 RepID=A0AAD3RFQ8_LATJO|nr:mitochondrial Rho GTPase 1-A isoform X1 [Lates japonicus]
MFSVVKLALSFAFYQSDHGARIDLQKKQTQARRLRCNVLGACGASGKAASSSFQEEICSVHVQHGGRPTKNIYTRLTTMAMYRPDLKVNQEELLGTGGGCGGCLLSEDFSLAQQVSAVYNGEVHLYRGLYWALIPSDRHMAQADLKNSTFWPGGGNRCHRLCRAGSRHVQGCSNRLSRLANQPNQPGPIASDPPHPSHSTTRAKKQIRKIIGCSGLVRELTASAVFEITMTKRKEKWSAAYATVMESLPAFGHSLPCPPVKAHCEAEASAVSLSEELSSEATVQTHSVSL